MAPTALNMGWCDVSEKGKNFLVFLIFRHYAIANYLRGKQGNVDQAIDDTGQDGSGPQSEAKTAPIIDMTSILIGNGRAWRNTCIRITITHCLGLRMILQHQLLKRSFPKTRMKKLLKLLLTTLSTTRRRGQVLLVRDYASRRRRNVLCQKILWKVCSRSKVDDMGTEKLLMVIGTTLMNTTLVRF